jgi:predicted outer membrane protein
MRAHLALAAALLTLPAAAHAQFASGLNRDAATVVPAGLGSVERSAQALREVDTTLALETVAALNAYQQEAGKLGQILGADIRVKRLGLDMQGDHGRMSDVVQAAARQSDVAVDADTALPPALQGRLDRLYRAAPESFDASFLDTQIAADREAIHQLDAARSPRLDPAAARALDTAQAMFQQRLDQTERLRSGG